MKIVAIVQARMNSTRFPNKVMKPIMGIPMIELLLKRISKSKKINKIIVATSTHKNNKSLVEHVKSLGFACEKGSENNVLKRFVDTAKKYKAEIVIRITGDCPLSDPILIDKYIEYFLDSKVDYLSNTNPPTYPDGLDVEIIKFEVLKKSLQETKDIYDQEHVTPYIYKQKKFSKINFKNKKDFSKLRWTVDEPEDFDVINNIFNYFSPNIYFGWEKIILLQKTQPELFLKNKKIARNQGKSMSTGQKLWQRAERIIPGGNMLLSKNPNQFLPQQWPTYFSKAKGCNVWDLDKNKYIDMSIMGIGTNTLGYGHPEVDESVKKAIRAGNMSTLNCAEEVYLAEKLIELHKWADMARFARTGGEANAIAIRIARAASGRDKIAICGYHGWHDWYLSANLGNKKKLDGHLFPGLETNGVPRNLSGTVFPFNYNCFDELEKLVKLHNIGIIKMEVMRNQEPTDNFLQKVRLLANKHNIVLIFDECTSGFRETFGGLHKKYDVEPDIAMFGKTLGNGYAVTAVIGKSEIMKAAQTSFISSTFWTERIGSAAGLKTMEIMEREKSWQTITQIGKKIREGWKKLSIKYDLKITNFGLPALSGFTIQSENFLAYKTLISQEMLKKGYLASNSVYACVEHKDKVLNGYFEALDPIFALIKECEEGRDVSKLLKGPICNGSFKRLN
jgi:glutamate-1-semialdehyde 2,1-aminomutase